MTRIICPICEATNFQKKFVVNGHVVYRCLACEVEFALPTGKQKGKAVTYDRGYFTGELAGVQGYENYQKLGHFLETESAKRIKFIKKFTSGKKLLDVGAGTGIFVSFAKSKGYRVVGNDISDFAVNAIRQKKIKALPGAVEKLKSRVNFDLVTAWDVIEHFDNFKLAITHLNHLLFPGGLLVFTTPFTDSVDCKILGKWWYGYKKIPEHIIFFNSKSIRYWLTTNGFELIAVKSWGFVRNVDFILLKLSHYSKLFVGLAKLSRRMGISGLTAFFPLTDFIVVARKKQ